MNASVDPSYRDDAHRFDTDPAPFPFSALIGQQTLQQALLLAAIDPGLGGVLVSGPRGTAKSTTARALAELLPHGQFVTLPLGASEEQLIGTLDIETALRASGVRFSAGLLAKAHHGVLYVDEVNLLPDPLVDQLLDVAASGVNTIERDGISHRHAARFVLIGTMNPEEGELRPQLLDRFGLMVELENCFDAPVRQQIVKARLAFDADPQRFRADYAAQQEAHARRIRDARAALARLSFGDAVHDRVSTLCIAAGVDGLRADLVMLKAARALASLEQADAIRVEHVDRVADLVLAHRRREGSKQREGESRAQQASQNGTPASAPRNAQRPSSDPGHTETPHTTEAGEWGFLAPEPVEIAPVKSVRPLPAKKP